MVIAQGTALAVALALPLGPSPLVGSLSAGVMAPAEVSAEGGAVQSGAAEGGATGTGSEDADPAEPEAGEGSGDESTADASPDASGVDSRPDDPDTVHRIEQAREHFVNGAVALGRGEYVEAAAEFERSYAYVEHGTTLWRVVEAYDNAGRPIQALNNARTYQDLPPCSEASQPCSIDQERTDVDERVRRLEQVVSELRLVLDDGVVLREVRVDGKPAPQSTFPRLVMPGAHTLHVFGVGEDEERIIPVEVAAGEARVVFVKTWEEPPPEVGPPIVGPTIDYARRKRIQKGLFWTGLSLTIASGIATAVLAAETRKAQDIFNARLCKGLPDVPCDSPIDPDSGNQYPASFENRSHKLQPITNALIGVTAALGVTTAVLGIFAFTKRKPAGANAKVQVRAGGLSVRF